MASLAIIQSIATGKTAMLKPTSFCTAALLLLVAELQTPALAQSTVNLQSAQTSQPGYVLGAGDQVEITVFEYEEFTGPKVILPDGTLSLPLIGSIMAANRTPDLLAREITARLQSYLVDPVVSINLTTLRPVVVNVAGEVQRPGPVQLRSLTTATTSNESTPGAALEAMPTVSSALMEAGGVTRNADIREVVLRRVLPGGETTTTTINLWDAIWSDNPPENTILQPGDAILVPRLAEGDTLDRRLVARSSLAPDSVRVRVVGEVTRPGEVAVSPDSSLSSAVAIAGGPTPDANLRRVEFVRLNEDGTINSQQVDLRNLTDEFQVQDGDVIIVPKGQTFTILDFAGRLLNPFGSLVNLINRL